MEEHLLRYELACTLVQGKNVLDAACGTGYGSKMMAIAGAASVASVDIDPDSIQLAKTEYHDDKIQFMTADVCALPFQTNTFDIVVSFETIEHIPDGDTWIKESWRVLKDDGLLLISTPNRHLTSPGRYREEKPLNIHHYSNTEFIGALLTHYDLIQLYSQSIVNDTDSISSQLVRQCADWIPAPKVSTAMNKAGARLYHCIGSKMGSRASWWRCAARNGHRWMKTL
jgi:ubiquinone/menaquinone biosynthesis C-methylase UbiE